MIKEGLFRLWVISAILFLAAAGAFFFRPVMAEFDKAGFAKSIQGSPVPMLPVACDGARGIKGRDFLTGWNGAICWYDIGKFRLLYPEYKDLPDAELARLMAQRAGWKPDQIRPWVSLAKVTAFIVAIPLVVLGWGWAVIRLFERLYQKSRIRAD